MSDLYHLAGILTNTNDKANDFIKEDDNLLSLQIDNADRYSIDGVRKWEKSKCVGWEKLKGQ